MYRTLLVAAFGAFAGFVLGVVFTSLAIDTELRAEHPDLYRTLRQRYDVPGSVAGHE